MVIGEPKIVSLLTCRTQIRMKYRNKNTAYPYFNFQVGGGNRLGKTNVLFGRAAETKGRVEKRLS